MYGESGNTSIKLISDKLFNGSPKSDKKIVSPLGAQSLSSKFDLESQLWWRARHHDRLRLRVLSKGVVLLFVLLMFFVFPLMNTVH